MTDLDELIPGTVILAQDETGRHFPTMIGHKGCAFTPGPGIDDDVWPRWSNRLAHPTVVDSDPGFNELVVLEVLWTPGDDD